MNRIQEFSSAIDGASRICIVTHTHPDGDAIGSTGAMLYYLAECRGKRSVIVLPDTLPDSLRFAMPAEGVIEADTAPEAAGEAISGADLLICLDFNIPRRAGSLESAILASKAHKVLVDHHPDPDTDAFGTVFSTTEISSASEHLYSILMQMPDIGGDISRLPLDAARSLLTGMTTDTNNFANSVFPSTLEMASALLARGVDRDAIIASLYNEYRENRVRAMAHMLGNEMRITPCGVAYMIMRKDVIGRFDVREGETEGLVNIPLSIGRVRVSIFLKEDDGFFRVSIRSRKGVSANRLARGSFNGGGHECASGGRLFFPGDIATPDDAASYIENVTAEFLASDPSNTDKNR